MANRKPENFPNYTKIRNAQRGDYDRAAGYEILDQGLIAHVGFLAEGRPMVIPMAFARLDDTLYLHGASKARIIRSNDETAPICITVTLLDGLVIARSAMHHGVNYRSVVVHGSARSLTSQAERAKALVATTDHLLPGRWNECRPMKPQEDKATGIIAVEIEHITSKVHNSLPGDDEADLALDMWSGVVPVTTALGHPLPDHNTKPNVPVPASIGKAKRKFA